MKIHKDIITVLVSALLITLLFHNQYLGLNVLIYESIFWFWLMLSKQFRFKGTYPITIGLGSIVTGLFTVITHSTFSYVIHFMVIILLVGIVLYPRAQSVTTSLKLAMANLIHGPSVFFNNLIGSKLKNDKVFHNIWRLRIFIVPVLVIMFFVVIYRISNSVFDKFLFQAGVFFQDQWDNIFRNLDFSVLLTFFIGFVISCFLLLRYLDQRIVSKDKISTVNQLRLRKKTKRKFQANSLKNEYRAGVFLLLTLNIIILILNVIDIKWVWFGFEWEGQYLKQFVHTGTYLLIFSILVSVAVVLYFFRGNLNFYKQNKLLKILSYMWLAQNAVLAISVGIRNYWYIKYYALAYKRIGVIIFLLLTIYGLYTVYNKVKNKKSTFYLFKMNAYAMLLVLMLGSCFNWDSIIAKYNFSHADQSFLHLRYLSDLSNKSLPHLDKSYDELVRLNKMQRIKFPKKSRYMSVVDYQAKIISRKEKFKKEWASRSFLSWNYADYWAYSQL